MKSDFFVSKQTSSLVSLGSYPLSRLYGELVIRGFSQRTIKSYLSYNQKFLDYIGKSAKEVCTDDLKNYLFYLKSNGYSNTSLNHVISALKFYYVDILKRKLFFNIIRPKREKFLPTVLAREEIIRIINVLSNPKHKLLLSLLYGSGLRVAEVVKLRIFDIDISKKLVLVKAGKGLRDRYTILSEHSIELLNLYLKTLPVEQPYLFAGAKLKSHLSSRSAQKIFSSALCLAGVKKKASCHSLRHSFATHLLARGVDIAYIQKLLGHQKIETTLVYAQVSDRQLRNIISPL